MSRLLLIYYADDFTGSTDALECLAKAGVRTALFIDPPTREQLQKHPDLQAIGVAGNTRCLPTAALETELRTAFPLLRDLSARHVHYKICSTFDSSPDIGSIGRAIDVGCETFETTFVPLVVGTPGLGRYCAFGNLFARMGIGSAGAIHRLDQHPAASNHAITPANESDLRLYLGEQTDRRIALFDVLKYELSETAANEFLDALIGEETIVLFDAIYPEHLLRIGDLIDSRVTNGPLFSVGSSAIETALVDHWRLEGSLAPIPSWPRPDEVEPLLVLSGSCSPVTEGQIKFAVASGFAEIRLDTEQLVRMDRRAEELQRASIEATENLAAGRSTIVHTGCGPDDPRLAATRELVSSELDSELLVVHETSKRLGDSLGEIGRRCVRETTLQRICVAGGDTSSHVARSLMIEALEMLAPLSPGAPLCRARAAGLANGIEFIFKGGQVGDDSYFETARLGTLCAR